VKPKHPTKLPDAAKYILVPKMDKQHLRFWHAWLRTVSGSPEEARLMKEIEEAYAPLTQLPLFAQP
jgi:hypothetical protein